MPFFTGVGQPIIGAAVGAAAGAAIGTAIPAGTDTPAGSGAAGRLRIEPEQVDAAIAVFRNALASVEAEVMNARRDINALAPAYDEVSRDAANAFNQVSYGNAVAAWEGAVSQLRSIIEQLEASKQTNVAADTDSASFLRPPG